MNVANNLYKNTIILGICTLLNKGLMFVMLPLFTRWLSVSDYGAYDVLATYISLLIPLVSLAAGNAIFRLSVDASEENKIGYFSSGLALYIVNSIIAVSILLLFKSYFNFTNLGPFIILLLGEILDNYFQCYLRANKDLPLYGLCRTATVVISAITITILVKGFDYGLTGLLLGYSSGYYISVILIICKTSFFKNICLKKISIYKIKELVNYSWPLIPNDISWWVINVSDRQIINLFLGASANGIYAIAYKIPNLCSSVFGVFNISWQESATEILSSADRETFYNNILHKTYNLIITLCIGLVSCNFLFFDYIFDARYSDARLYSSILVASIIFSTISIFYGGIQISLKRPKANGISTLIGAIVNLVIHLLLVDFIGLYAAAFSTLISNAVVLYIRKYMLRKIYNIKLDLKCYCLVPVFIYFSIFSMIRTNLLINIVNVIFAAAVFLLVNRDIILKTLRHGK